MSIKVAIAGVGGFGYMYVENLCRMADEKKVEIVAAAEFFPEKWQDRIEPVLGKTDLMVYARNADIAAPGTYSGDKFSTLYDGGFRYYFGFCTDGKPWFVAESNYIRQGRILVSAENLTQHADWFAGILNPAAILVENR